MLQPEDLEHYVELVAERSLRTTPVRPIPEPNVETQALISHAAGHAGIGQLQEGTRFRRLKGLLLRLLRLVTGPQVAFNMNSIAAVQNLEDDLAALRSRLDQAEKREAATLASHRTMIELELDATREALLGGMGGLAGDIARIDEAVTRVRDDLVEVHGRLEHSEVRAMSARLSDRIEGLALDLRGLRSRLDMLLVEARRRLPEPFDVAQLQTFAGQLTGRFDAVYADFEEGFRGSRAEVKARLGQYVSLVESLPAPTFPVVDIGCGRGEWLDLLAAAGVEAYGIDTNTTFVENGLAAGLDVRLGDALELLGAVAPGSVRAVTGFHIAEHLDFTNLIALIEVSLQALGPGGMLLLETPNPTNLVVGAASFYLDPTHVKPLHPLLMEFLFTAHGFVDVEIRYVNPAPNESRLSLAGPGDPELQRVEDLLNWSFFGPQDFAVVGRKPPGTDG